MIGRVFLAVVVLEIVLFLIYRILVYTDPLGDQACDGVVVSDHLTHHNETLEKRLILLGYLILMSFMLYFSFDAVRLFFFNHFYF